jgi:RNase P subunit RPR2
MDCLSIRLNKKEAKKVGKLSLILKFTVTHIETIDKDKIIVGYHNKCRKEIRQKISQLTPKSTICKHCITVPSYENFGFFILKTQKLKEHDEQLTLKCKKCGTQKKIKSRQYRLDTRCSNCLVKNKEDLARKYFKKHGGRFESIYFISGRAYAKGY